MMIRKNYFSFGFRDKFRILGLGLKFILPSFLGASALCNKVSHKNNAYKIKYPLTQYVTSYLGEGSLMKTK